MLHLIGDKAPPDARDSSEVARGGLIWYLNSSLSLSVEVSVQDGAMDVAWSKPLRAHYHADVI